MRDRQSERGIALLAVFGVAMLFAITLTLVLTLSMNRARSTYHGVERLRARSGAESGYWVALARVFEDPTYAGTFQITFPADPHNGKPQDIVVVVTVTDLGNGQKRVESVVDYENL